MYAEDLIAGPGQVSAAGGIVTLSFGCRLNWYRALPVSCVEHLAVTVDGTPLPPGAVTVRLNGRPMTAVALVEHDDDWWPTGAIARLDCLLGPQPARRRYEVVLDIGIRVPYMGPMPDGSWRLVRDQCTARVPA
jgi:Domain of unknown function (DUF6379)